MSRLKEIQENYAKEKGFSSFFIMYCDSNYEETQKYTRDITNIYAEECIKASLEKASENAELDFVEDEPIYGYVGIKEESITNPENIILL